MAEILVYRVTDDSEFDLIFDIRRTVFTGEQNVSEEDEFDGHDHISHHYIAYFGDKACGTARWRITPSGKIKLERFAVLKEFRGKGVGEALVKAVLSQLPKNFKIYLHAQVQVIPFYEKLGFTAEGPEFDECDIMHRKMVFEK
ncbi:MAG: GNAT family N-acetyltransferase [Bacteroidia bacterium]|nr:GNAT family N-acetyltransferase [Bacteroidia bacterium]